MPIIGDDFVVQPSTFSSVNSLSEQPVSCGAIQPHVTVFLCLYFKNIVSQSISDAKLKVGLRLSVGGLLVMAGVFCNFLDFSTKRSLGME